MKINLLFAIIWASFCLTACQNREVSAEGFVQITYKTGPVAANRGPATLIKIFKKNDSLKYTVSKHYRFISKEDGSMKDKVDVIKNGTVSSGQLDSLFGLINTNNFMSLNAMYRDPDILDGDVESIKLELKDNVKEVVVANRQIKRFNKVAGYVEGIAEVN